jgi:toxin CptA
MLRISLKPSRILALLLLLAHALSLAVLWPLALPLWLRAAGGAAVLASAIFYIRRDALLAARGSVVALTLHTDGGAAIERRDGVRREAQLVDEHFVSARVAIARYRLDGERRRRSVTVLPDMISNADFRALRVHLKWRGHAREKEEGK